MTREEIDLWCPGCGRRASRMPRAEYDPPDAVTAKVLCERCCIERGAKEPPTHYRNAKGEEIES